MHSEQSDRSAVNHLVMFNQSVMFNRSMMFNHFRCSISSVVHLSFIFRSFICPFIWPSFMYSSTNACIHSFGDPTFPQVFHFQVHSLTFYHSRHQFIDSIIPNKIIHSLFQSVIYSFNNSFNSVNNSFVGEFSNGEYFTSRNL